MGIFASFALFLSTFCSGGCCWLTDKCINSSNYLYTCKNTELQFSNSVCLEGYGPFPFFGRFLTPPNGCVSNDEIRNATSLDILRTNVAIKFPFFLSELANSDATMDNFNDEAKRMIMDFKNSKTKKKTAEVKTKDPPFNSFNSGKENLFGI